MSEIRERDNRTLMLIGEDGLEKLNKSKILLFGIGGVGGYVCEALVRAGIGHMHIVDNDVVSESNINRQIIADYSTIGKNKVDVMESRVLVINPTCHIEKSKVFYLPATDEAESFDFSQYDYIIDAIDTTSAKLDIIEKAKNNNVPIISSMGTGNKLGLKDFKISDISKTTTCPLAKVIRKELRTRGIKNVKVLYSEEEPIKRGNSVPGSISFVPAIAGLTIAGEVIRDIIGGDLIEK